MLKRLLTVPLARTLAIASGPARAIFSPVSVKVSPLALVSVPQRGFPLTPPPPPPPQQKGSKVDQYLATTVAELERRQREKIIMKPNEYFSQLERVMRMLEDPRNGSLTSEESISALIYLCVMTAHSMPKLAPLEVVRAVQFLYQLSAELGFRFPKEHMESVLAAIPDPFPKDLERVFPFFIKLVCRLPDPSVIEHIRPRVGSMTDKYLSKHKDELKVQDISSILEAWLQVGYKNDESLKIMKEHLKKFGKIMTFTPSDVHVLFYFEATQLKEHDKDYLNLLIEKAKEHAVNMDLYLLTNLLAFKKTLNIQDEEFSRVVVEAIRVFLNTEKVQLPPLTYTQLLMALSELDPTKNKDLQDKIVQHFIDDKTVLQNPNYWNTLPVYLLMVAADQIKTDKKDFYTKAEGLIEKAILNMTPDFIVPMAKVLFKSRFGKVRTIVANFAEACKKLEKMIKPEDKQALKVLVGDSKEFAGFTF